MADSTPPVTKVDIPQVLNWILDWEGHESLGAQAAALAFFQILEQSHTIR